MCIVSNIYIYYCKISHKEINNYCLLTIFLFGTSVVLIYFLLDFFSKPILADSSFSWPDFKERLEKDIPEELKMAFIEKLIPMKINEVVEIIGYPEVLDKVYSNNMAGTEQFWNDVRSVRSDYHDVTRKLVPGFHINDNIHFLNFTVFHDHIDIENNIVSNFLEFRVGLINQLANFKNSTTLSGLIKDLDNIDNIKDQYYNEISETNSRMLENGFEANNNSGRDYSHWTDQALSFSLHRLFGGTVCGDFSLSHAETHIRNILHFPHLHIFPDHSRWVEFTDSFGLDILFNENEIEQDWTEKTDSFDLDVLFTEDNDEKVNIALNDASKDWTESTSSFDLDKLFNENEIEQDWTEETDSFGLDLLFNQN